MGASGGKSVWWSMPTFSGSVTIDTIRVSDFDTLLAVYTGSSVSALTPVAADDDGGGNMTSKVTFNVVAGTPYAIAVDGWGGAFGNITLHVNLTAPSGPANNNFANRTSISSSSATVTGTNIGETRESGEPNHVGASGGKSVWWSFTPTSSGSVTIDTIGSNFDTLLAVYTGSSVSALTPVAADDDGGGNMTSKVTFNVVAGTPYAIAVDGWGGAFGNITLHVNLTSAGDQYEPDNTAVQATTIFTNG